MTPYDSLQRHFIKNSVSHSSSSADTEVQSINSVCGISGSVMLLSVLHLDIVNTNLGLRSIYSMRRQKKSTIKMPNIDAISHGFGIMPMNMDGIKVIKRENISMPMRSNLGIGDISEFLSPQN